LPNRISEAAAAAANDGDDERRPEISYVQHNNELIGLERLNDGSERAAFKRPNCDPEAHQRRQQHSKCQQAPNSGALGAAQPGQHNQSAVEVPANKTNPGPDRAEPSAAAARPLASAKSPLCQLTARTKDNQCSLHGADIALCRLDAGAASSTGTTTPTPAAAATTTTSAAGNERTTTTTAAATASELAPPTSAKRARRTPKDKARSVSTWPLAKQTLDNNLPNEFRLGHFGDCEDLLSAHLAGRLFGALTAHDLIIHQASKSIPLGMGPNGAEMRAACEMIAKERRHCQCRRRHHGHRHHHHRHHRLAHVIEWPSLAGVAVDGLPFDQLVFQSTADELRLVDQLRAFNYNHKRPFALPYESPSAGWLFNATGLQPINSGSAQALRGKCCRRRAAASERAARQDFELPVTSDSGPRSMAAATAELI
jgi:hypothetical protein